MSLIQFYPVSRSSTQFKEFKLIFLGSTWQLFVTYLTNFSPVSCGFNEFYRDFTGFSWIVRTFLCATWDWYWIRIFWVDPLIARTEFRRVVSARYVIHSSQLSRKLRQADSQPPTHTHIERAREKTIFFLCYPACLSLLFPSSMGFTGFFSTFFQSCFRIDLTNFNCFDLFFVFLLVLPWTSKFVLTKLSFFCHRYRDVVLPEEVFDVVGVLSDGLLLEAYDVPFFHHFFKLKPK